MPTLDEIRVLDADALNDEQKEFLIAHKDELSAEEQTKFATVLTADNGEGDPADPADPAADPADPADPVDADNKNNKGAGMTDEQKEAAQVQADIKSGKKVLMDASEVQTMKGLIEAHGKQLDSYREKEVNASVLTHMKRGAIKADQVDNWTKRIMADASVEDLLKSIPDNKLVASEVGSSNAVDQATPAQAFEDAVQAEIKASNGTLDYSKAVVLVAQKNPQLAKDRQASLTAK